MIIYEKKDTNGVKRLFGNIGSTPAADDQMVVLVDADGDTINPRPTLSSTYVNIDKGIARLSDNQKVNVGIKYTEAGAEKIKWVIGVPVDKVLASLKVKTQPTKTEYIKGETFDKTGLTATAIFASGEKEVIGADKLVCTPTTLTEAGAEVEVTVSYTTGAVTKSFVIKVKVTE